MVSTEKLKKKFGAFKPRRPLDLNDNYGKEIIVTLQTT
jgi:hypothetical protein